MNNSYNNIINGVSVIKDEFSPYKRYPKKVLSGEIVANKWIKLLCERYMNMFTDERYYFDKKEADKVIKFFNMLTFFEGPKAGKPYELIPYQEWLLHFIFGFHKKENNSRVIQKVLLFVTRKNNKSTWAAALALYLMITDGQGTQCLNVANSTKQSSILFRMEQELLKPLNKNKRFRIMRDKILFNKMKSFCMVLSSDSGSIDGYGGHGILDEAENYKTSELYDVIVSGQGVMKSPLTIIISTGGFLGPGSFLYDYVESCKAVLSGLVENESLLPALYMLDEGDDWRDESVWEKAIPALDITVTRDYIRQMVQDAKTNSTLEVSVRTKNFNEFVQNYDIWIKDSIIITKMRKFDDIQELNQEYLDAYYGIDLASSDDMNSLARCINIDGISYISLRYYIPHDCIEESPNKELYKQWIREGYLTVTDGNVTDTDYIVNDLYKETDFYNVGEVGYDKWAALNFTVKCTDLGINMQSFAQSIGAFSPFVKAFETDLKKGTVILEYNPILRWNFMNATLKTDHNENVKPVKSSKDKKIDGVISAIMAYGSYLKNSNSSIQSMYLGFNG